MTSKSPSSLSSFCFLPLGYCGRKHKGDWGWLSPWPLPTERRDPRNTLGWYYPGKADHSLTCGRMGQRVATWDRHKHGERAREQTTKSHAQGKLKLWQFKAWPAQTTSQLGLFRDQVWQNLKPLDLFLLHKQKVLTGNASFYRWNGTERTLSPCRLP